MATKKKTIQEATEEVVEAEVVVAPVRKTTAKVAAPSFNPIVPKRPRKAEKKLTFSKYVNFIKAKPHHIAGMKAFVSNPNLPRTLKEWDDIFSTY